MSEGEQQSTRLHPIAPPPRYIGWIPCVLGELFFELSDVGLGEYDVYNVNAPHAVDGDSHGFPVQTSHDGFPIERRIVATSVVNWRDSIFHPKTPRNESAPRGIGWFRVIVTGYVYEVNGTRHFSGIAAIVDQADKPGETSTRNATSRKSEHTLVNFINEIDRTYSGSERKAAYGHHETGRTCRERAWNAIAKFHEGIGPAGGDEAICCSGDKLFNLLTQMTAKNRVVFDLEIDSHGVFELRLTHSSFAKDKLSNDTLARQTGHYVKYLFHKHTHHHFNSESLTTVQPLLSDKASALNEVLRQILRSYAQSKRAPRKDVHEARGYLAYAKSLSHKIELIEQNATGEEHRGATSNDGAHRFKNQNKQIDCANQSISTRIDQEQRAQERDHSSRDRTLYYVGLLLAVLGPLLFSALSIHSGSKGLSPNDSLEVRSLACSVPDNVVCSFENFLAGGVLPLLIVYVALGAPLIFLRTIHESLTFNKLGFLDWIVEHAKSPLVENRRFGHRVAYRLIWFFSPIVRYIDCVAANPRTTHVPWRQSAIGLRLATGSAIFLGLVLSASGFLYLATEIGLI